MRILARSTNLVLTLLILALSSCALGSETTGSAMQNSPNSITVTDTDNGREVHVAPGGILTLRLEATPGTGYAWQVVKNHPALLKQLGETIFQDTGKNMPGVAEYQIFQFKALARGSNTLRLQYVREWEKDVKPINTYCIRVEIR